MDDVAKIARGLTGAQRWLIWDLSSYCDPNTKRSLQRRGLLKGGLLTPLGLSVREYLEKSDG